MDKSIVIPAVTIPESSYTLTVQDFTVFYEAGIPAGIRISLTGDPTGITHVIETRDLSARATADATKTLRQIVEACTDLLIAEKTNVQIENEKKSQALQDAAKRKAAYDKAVANGDIDPTTGEPLATVIADYATRIENSLIAERNIEVVI